MRTVLIKCSNILKVLQNVVMKKHFEKTLSMCVSMCLVEFCSSELDFLSLCSTGSSPQVLYAVENLHFANNVCFII